MINARREQSKVNADSRDMKEAEKTDFRQALEAALASFQIGALTEGQLDQLAKHYSLLVTWNRKINLTRITKPGDAAQLHYAESLFGGQFIENGQTVLDIGSGAGFPAVPLAVLRPDLEVTALEANVKKSVFLKEAKDLLGLSNFKVICARLEEFDWSGYDVLTSRALEAGSEVWASTMTKLGSRQRLMLYTTAEVLATANKRLRSILKETGPGCDIHPIPHAESRLIAIFGM